MNLVIIPTSFHENTKDASQKDLIITYARWIEDEKRRENSYLNEVFSGDLLIQLQCSKCRYTKFSFNKFSDLVLNLCPKIDNCQVSVNYKRLITNHHNIPKSSVLRQNISTLDYDKHKSKNINNLIHDFFQEEEVDDYICVSCKNKGIHFKKCMIWTFPKTLFQYIKRFEYYPVMEKLKEPVIISELTINITNYKQTFHNANELQRVKKYFTGRQCERGDYKQCGYINHLGEEVNTGHYIAYCNKFDGTWIEYDDEHVRRISNIQKENLFQEGSPEIYIIALQLIE